MRENELPIRQLRKTPGRCGFKNIRALSVCQWERGRPKYIGSSAAAFLCDVIHRSAFTSSSRNNNKVAFSSCLLRQLGHCPSQHDACRSSGWRCEVENNGERREESPHTNADFLFGFGSYMHEAYTLLW
jgi:hypothetical protein